MTKYKTKIFVQNLVAIDLAILSKTSGLLGKSLSLDIAFEGIKNSNGMLVDFSLAKKIVKSIVENFDHKLIVTPAHVKFKSASTTIVSQLYQPKKSSYQDSLFFAMSAKSSWIQIVLPKILNSLEGNNFSQFEKLLENLILKKMPKNITRVCAHLSDRNLNTSEIMLQQGMQERMNRFWYMHSLCRHKGQCQRLHGHSAEVNVYENKKLDYELSTEIAKHLSGLYIIQKQSLRPLYNSPQLKKIKKFCLSEKTFENLQGDLNAIEYQGSQGRVAIVVSKNRSLLLENESTVENITEYIRGQIPLKNVDVCIYEGLNKGAVVS